MSERERAQESANEIVGHVTLIDEATKACFIISETDREWLESYLLQREREARIEENQQWIKWLDKPHGGGPADFDFDDRIAELTQKDGDDSV